MRNEEYIAIKDRAADVFMRIPHVNAVGLGGREKDGQPTGEIVIKVFIDRKMPPEEVPPQELIPAEFEGIPTDIDEMGPVVLTTANPPHGMPLKTKKALLAEGDKEKSRPLLGGIQLQVDRLNSDAGTLGCLMIDPGDPNKVYALTAFHVLNTGSGSLTTSTKVGQPTKYDSSTGCCSDLFGKFAGGAKDIARDAALVRLDPGTKYKKEIKDIGPVKGTSPVTIGDKVKQRGRSSRLTGGVVLATNAVLPPAAPGVTRTNMMVIQPNPDPAQPGTQLHFNQEGDSGSVVLNEANKVVGLLWGEGQPGSSDRGNGIATPIAAVIKAFDDEDGIKVEVATENSPGKVYVVPGAAKMTVEPEPMTGRSSLAKVRAPVTEERPALPAAHRPARSGLLIPDAIETLEAALSRSSYGEWLRELWLRHQAEFKALVNENRRVATVWHRSGGAELFQALFCVFHDPEAVVPKQIHDAPISQCIGKLDAVFSKYGSEPLVADMARVRPALPDIGGLSYSGIVATIGNLAPQRSGTPSGESRRGNKKRATRDRGSRTERS